MKLQPGTTFNEGFREYEIINGNVSFDAFRVQSRLISSLTNLYTVSSPRVNGVIRLQDNRHSWTHNVGHGELGSYTKTRSNAAGSYIYSKSGCFGVDGGLRTHTDSSSYNNCLEGLYSIIRGNIDLSIDLVQGKKTIELARSILKATNIVHQISRASKYLTSSGNSRKRVASIRGKRSKTPFDWRTPMKEVGGLHLQFTYGLKPTLQTIHDLVKGEATRVGNSLTIRKPGRRRNGVTGVYSDNGAEVIKGPYSTFRRISSSSYRTKIGGTYAPSTGYVESLSRLTSLNPASILWESLPFSFVVDWFYDVGGYLRSMESAIVSNKGVFSGYKTMTHLHKNTISTVYNGTDSLSYVWQGYSEGSRYQTSLDRSLLTSLPLPRRPSFTANLGSARLINAAALLSQFIGYKRR